jgi:hypothetical protein
VQTQKKSPALPGFFAGAWSMCMFSKFVCGLLPNRLDCWVPLSLGVHVEEDRRGAYAEEIRDAHRYLVIHADRH